MINRHIKQRSWLAVGEYEDACPICENGFTHSNRPISIYECVVMVIAMSINPEHGNYLLIQANVKNERGKRIASMVLNFDFVQCGFYLAKKHSQSIHNRFKVNRIDTVDLLAYTRSILIRGNHSFPAISISSKPFHSNHLSLFLLLLFASDHPTNIITHQLRTKHL